MSATLSKPVSYTHLDVYKRQGQLQMVLQGVCRAVPVAGQSSVQNFQMLLTGLRLIDHAHREMCIRDRSMSSCMGAGTSAMSS